MNWRESSYKHLLGNSWRDRQVIRPPLVRTENLPDSWENCRDLWLVELGKLSVAGNEGTSFAA